MANISNDNNENQVNLYKQLQNSAEKALESSATLNRVKLFEDVATSETKAEDFLKENIDTSGLNDEQVKSLLDKLIDYVQDLAGKLSDKAMEQEEYAVSESGIKESAAAAEYTYTITPSDFVNSYASNDTNYSNIILAVVSGDTSSISHLGANNVLAAINIISEGVSSETAAKLKASQGAVTSLSDMLNESTQRFSSNENRIAQLTTLIEQNKELSAQAQGFLDVLGPQVEAKEQQIAQVQEKIDEIQKRIDEKQLEVNKKQAEKSLKESEIAAKDCQISSKESDISNKEGEITAKNDEITAKNGEIKAKKAEIKTQKGVVKNCEKQYSAAQKSVKSLSAQLSRLQSSNKDGKNDAQIASVSAQLSAARAEEARAKAELDAAKADLARMQEELKALQEELKVLKQELTALKKELSTLKKELKTLNNEKKKLEKELAKIEKEKAKLDQELNKVKAEQEPYNMVKEGYVNEKNELVAQISEYEKQKQQADDNVVKYTEEKEQLENENTTLKTTIQDLKADLAAAQQEHAQLLAQAKAELKQYADETKQAALQEPPKNAEGVDEDGDQQVTLDEVIKNLKARGVPDEKMPEKLEDVDTNHDGIVTETEINNYILTKFSFFDSGKEKEDGDSGSDPDSKQPLDFVG